jgi:hypothetical protein
MEPKCCACDTQAGSLVRAASGEFGEGGSPARNRAASSAVAVSELLARSAPNATVKAIRIAAIILVAFTDTFCSGSAYPPQWLVKVRLRQNCGGICFLDRYASRHMAIPNAREREALEAANLRARSHKSRESC